MKKLMILTLGVLGMVIGSIAVVQAAKAVGPYENPETDEWGRQQSTRTLITYTDKNYFFIPNSKIVLNTPYKPMIVTSISQPTNNFRPTSAPGPQFLIGSFIANGIEYLLTVANGTSTSGDITSVATIVNGSHQYIALSDFSGTFVKTGGTYYVDITIYSLGISYNGPSL